MLTRLRLQRILNRFTLYDLRALTGIAVSKLSLVERGIETAREDEQELLAKALGVSVESIFPVVDMPDVGEEVT